jgi:hypothetical protein
MKIRLASGTNKVYLYTPWFERRIKMELTPLTDKLHELAKGLSQAQTSRERVRIANVIYETVHGIEEWMDWFVAANFAKGNRKALVIGDQSSRADSTPPEARFKNMSIAAASKLLLTEHGMLHGSEIERMLRAGGYETKARRFQNVMRIALEKDGGFVNIGGNLWKLKSQDRAELTDGKPCANCGEQEGKHEPDTLACPDRSRTFNRGTEFKPQVVDKKV